MTMWTRVIIISIVLVVTLGAALWLGIQLGSALVQQAVFP